MADKFLNLTGLQEYDSFIKNHISEEDAKSIKLVKVVGDKIQFFKSETDNGTADFEFTINNQDLSDLLKKITDGISGNVVVVGENGTVEDSGTAFLDMATKSDVEQIDKKVGDTSDLSTTSKTEIVGAINELKESIDNNKNDSAITIDDGDTTDGYLKSYTIKQGQNTIGVIDIPKDLLGVTGSVEEDPDDKDPGTYIKLEINGQEEPIYINVSALLEEYTVEEEAVQIQLEIDKYTREISATIVAGSVGTTELAENAVTTEKIANSNVTYDKLAENVKNAFDTAGSANNAEINAKNYAKSLDDATNERIDELEVSSEGITPISTEEIKALFAD